jgi:hypothetical protein
MLRQVLFIFLCLATYVCGAQVTGGESIFQFLRVAPNAHITAMGGMCVSNPSADHMLSIANPALLQKKYHNQLGISNNFYLAGTNINTVQYVHHSAKLNTTFAGGAQWINYGKQFITDVYGNVQGEATAQDLAAHITASRTYLTKWQYGTTLKIANSQFTSSFGTGIAADFGVQYLDTTNQFYFGLLAKNMGVQIKKYSATSGNEPMPFDLQLGLTKKFLKAPIRLNLITHHLNQWDIRYDNPADRTDNIFGQVDSSAATKTYFADKLFRHVNFSVDLLLGKRLTAIIGYSHQRRGELSIKEKQGVAGFSGGLALHLPKFDIYYGRSVYHLSGAYNEVSVNLKLKEAFGLGKHTY